MSAIVNNIVRATDLRDLILQAIRNVCCNIDADVDNSFYTSKTVKTFNTSKTRNHNAGTVPKGGNKDTQASTYYTGNYTVSATATISQTGITVPSRRSYSDVQNIVQKFFNNTILPILNNKIISAYQYYHINECIKRFIDDTIVCCVSPYYSVVRFYFDGSTGKTYQYTFSPIVSSSYLNSELQTFYSKDTLDFINLAFTKTDNIRICTYTASLS